MLAMTRGTMTEGLGMGGQDLVEVVEAVVEQEWAAKKSWKWCRVLLGDFRVEGGRGWWKGLWRLLGGWRDGVDGDDRWWFFSFCVWGGWSLRMMVNEMVYEL